MGRLFWKFFFAFCIAVLFAGMSVGAIMWVKHNIQTDEHNQKHKPHAPFNAKTLISVALPAFSSLPVSIVAAASKSAKTKSTFSA